MSRKKYAVCGCCERIWNSPDCIIFFRLSALHAKNKPDDALLIATEYLAEVYFFTLFSNSMTLGPCVRKSDFITLTTSFISELLIVCLPISNHFFKNIFLSLFQS